MLVHKSFRFRVYPTSEQIARISQWESSLRFLWNLAHEQHLLGLARTDKRYPTAFDQHRDLTDLRAELPWLAAVPRNVCAQLLVELDKAWQRCFKKLARRPHWKRKGRDFLSLTEPHPNFWRFDGSTLLFPKLGPMRAVVHRPLEGKPKTCTISRDGDQWFVSICCTIEIADPVPPTGYSVAIDRGATNLLADSNGRIVPNPKHLERAQRRLAHAQRVVARRKKGSKNQEKAKLRVARIHRKVRRQRDHVLHVESARYAKNHGVVVLEDLKVRQMTKSAAGTVDEPGTHVAQKRRLNCGILAAAWGRFGTMVEYKSVWSGAVVAKVRPAYSSMTCSACGHVAAESRKGEVFLCVSCGHHDHADVNAAKVLLSRRTDGGAVCGGSAEARRPVKQKLRVARRGTRSVGAF